MPLSPLARRPSASEAAEKALRQAILSGEIEPGDRLPPERELCATLGISRLTLRAALASLTSAGLLDVTHGSGYRTRDYRTAGGPDLLPGLLDLVTQPADLVPIIEDLLRVRRHLAAAVLESLAAHPPGHDRIDRFVAAIDEMAAVIDAGEDTGAIAQADLAVVRALVAATPSAVLPLCHNPIAQVVAESASLRAAIYAQPQRSVVAWHTVAAWLRKPSASSIGNFIAMLERHDRSTLSRLSPPTADEKP